MTKFQHDPAYVSIMNSSMDKARTAGETLENTMNQLLNGLTSSFKGEAAIALASLLEAEVKKVVKEKENWSELISKAKKTAANIEEEDHLKKDISN